MKYLLPFVLFICTNSFSQTTGCPVPVINYSIHCGDDSTQLTASSGYSTYSWAPASGVSNPSISDPMVVLSSTPTTYTLTATNDTDLIVNGDFGLGNTGFISALNFTSVYSPGDYYVAPTFFLTSYSMGDHTPTTDEMFMSVDGISTVSTLWEQTVSTILPSTNYQFSFWSTDCNVNPPIFEIHLIGNVTGDVIVATITATLGAGVWHWDQISPPLWNSGANTSVIIRVKNLETAGYGNDFGLDDFSFLKSCTTTAMVTVSDHSLIPNFNADSICVGTAATFTDLSAGGPPTTWNWDFGDGGTSTSGPVTTHTYAATGTYTVSLRVTAAGGCDSTITLPVTVGVIPGSNYTADSVCVGTATSFTDLSTGGPVSWHWDFGDGVTSNAGPAVTHLYAAAGTYNASLSVTNSNGCSDVLTQPVIVYAAPAASFSSDTVCLNTATTFTDLSTGSPVSWSWDFGDGSPVVTTLNATHVYNTAGSYVVTHVVTSSHGCASTATGTIVFNPLPVAAFATSSTCVMQQSLFTDNSTGPPASWSWSFGDGSNSLIQDPSHLYSSSGSYTVTLIVNTAQGCADTLSQPVTISPQPNASFTSNVACSGDATSFTNTSTTPDGSIVGVWWNFEDGTTSVLNDPNHALGTESNSFNVIMAIITSYGCVDTVTETVTTNPRPLAGFSFTQLNETLTLQFTDTSTGATLWNWNLGDGTTSTLENPSQTYPDAGTHLITQIVTNQYGCSDTASYSIEIDANTTMYIPNAFTPNGNSLNDVFMPKMSGVLEFQMFIYDRWGNKIFETENRDEGWNGRVKGIGDVVQQDVYVYQIFTKDLLRNDHNYIGGITVVR